MEDQQEPAAGPAGLPVAAVARRLGVAPATLRTWARRYGLGPSTHEPGAHRRYSPDDLERLVVMRRLTLEGSSPVDAARVARAGGPGAGAAEPTAGPTSGLTSGPEPDVTGELTLEPDPPAVPAAPGAPGRAHPEVSTSTQLDSRERILLDRAALTRRPSPAGRDHLERAVLASDAVTCTALIATECLRVGPVAAYEDLVRPALRELGRRWEVTGVGVDTAALLTAATLAALRELPPVPWRTSAVVLVAAVEQEVSSLPLHVLAAAVAADGVRAWVLAAGLPREAVAAAVRRTGPVTVVLHASAPVTDACAQLAGLPRLRPPARLVLSGPGWASAPVPRQRRAEVAGGLGQAADLVRGATAS